MRIYSSYVKRKTDWWKNYFDIYQFFNFFLWRSSGINKNTSVHLSWLTLGAAIHSCLDGLTSMQVNLINVICSHKNLWKLEVSKERSTRHCCVGIVTGARYFTPMVMAGVPSLSGDFRELTEEELAWIKYSTIIPELKYSSLSSSHPLIHLCPFSLSPSLPLIPSLSHISPYLLFPSFSFPLSNFPSLFLSLSQGLVTQQIFSVWVLQIEFTHLDLDHTIPHYAPYRLVLHYLYPLVLFLPSPSDTTLQ